MKTGFANKGKKILMSLLISASLALIISSCKKDNSNSNDTVTVDDAADAVTEAVTPESAGMVAQTETSAEIMSSESLSCGTASDTSISGHNIEGAAVTYNYNLSWNSLLSCNNLVPSQFQFNFSGKFSYDAPRISSDDSSMAQFTVAGLEPGASQYIFNQTYTRDGSQVSKVRNKRSFSSKISIVSSNIAVDKSTQQIVSGTASVSISGSGSDGRSFSYSGTITFLGNKQATLVLGNGSTYTIQWS